MKINQEFEVTTKVSEANKCFIFIQVNCGNFEYGGEKFQVHYDHRIRVVSDDGKVIASVEIGDLVNDLAEIVKNTKRSIK